MLRHEIRYQEQSNWTGKHRRWLQSLSFSLPHEQETFLEYYEEAKRRVGSITKAGNWHLRKVLMEAAWHARSYHAHSATLRRAREGLPADVVNYADRAGRRLTKKFNRLRYANRPAQVAATAVARELAGFIWGMMVGHIA